MNNIAWTISITPTVNLHFAFHKDWKSLWNCTIMTVKEAQGTDITQLLQNINDACTIMTVKEAQGTDITQLLQNINDASHDDPSPYSSSDMGDSLEAV